MRVARIYAFWPALTALSILVGLGCAGMGNLFGSSKPSKEEQFIKLEQERAELCMKQFQEREENWKTEYAKVLAMPLDNETLAKAADEAYDEALANRRAVDRSRCDRNPESVQKDRYATDKMKEAAVKYRTPYYSEQQRIEGMVAELNRDWNTKLTEGMIRAEDWLSARTMLARFYEDDATKVNEVPAELAKRIAVGYNKFQLKRFKTNGAYAHIGEGRRKQGCIFSTKPFPKKLPKKPGKIFFDTHLDKATKVYVLCRLPNEAKTYHHDIDPSLRIQLVSDNGSGHVFVFENFHLPVPSTLGTTHEVRGEFALPPSHGNCGKMHRCWFDVRVVSGFSVRDRFGEIQLHTKAVSQSSFTWTNPNM